ncbi:DUF2345 domain-containing protein, partial [Xanthomonas fragariae]|uniref:DUF2345 domain-containing protein n=1 Tax=Xanthomonas fragariae TaxID=48664 RepID=UPI001F21B80D
TQNGSAAGQLQGGSSPALLGSGSAGVMSLTPADQVWVSGTQTTLLAGTALNWASQAQLVLAVAGGLVLYTQGSAPVAGSPNQERGIALHAAPPRSGPGTRSCPHAGPATPATARSSADSAPARRCCRAARTR